MSFGPMVALEPGALTEGVGVLSRSFSEPLAGVAGVTFSGSAEEAISEEKARRKVEDHAENWTQPPQNNGRPRK
jgi:hypothetical protein